MIEVYPLRMELDSIISDIDHEKLVLENLKRCRRKIGASFQVILWNKNLSQKEIKDFTSRNQDTLFYLNTKITSKIANNSCWFIIKTSEEEKSKWRYMYEGSDVLQGIISYMNLVLHIKDRK